MGPADWPDADALRAEQVRVAGLEPPPWAPPVAGPLTAIGCFVAFHRGEQGPGRAGDRAWVGVAVWSEATGVISTGAEPGVARARYAAGLLALREGPMLVDALAPAVAATPGAVLLVDATGRDHPRRAGLALHLGHLLAIPTVGVTHRPLTAARPIPVLDRRGQSEPIELDGETVGAWVCTADGARPVVAHAAWRTDTPTAVEVAVRTSTTARTPEPLRLARQAARNARHRGEPTPVRQQR
jgi:deoxyribonuclease V